MSAPLAQAVPCFRSSRPFSSGTGPPLSASAVSQIDIKQASRAPDQQLHLEPLHPLESWMQFRHPSLDSKWPTFCPTFTQSFDYRKTTPGKDPHHPTAMLRYLLSLPSRCHPQVTGSTIQQSRINGAHIPFPHPVDLSNTRIITPNSSCFSSTA